MNDPSESINRILALIPYIREHPGVSIQELASLFRCRPKEIMADLDQILLCGVPPYLPDDYIGVFIEEGCVEIAFADHFSRPINLTLQEGLALRLALEQLPSGGHPTLRAARKSLLAKVNDLIRAEGLEDRLVAHREEDRLGAHLDTLTTAAAAQRKVRMAYYSQTSDALRERTVHPYEVVENKGEFYLVGHDEFRDRLLTFRVDRIRWVEPTDEQFERPSGLDLERLVQERRRRGFVPAEKEAQPVRIRFSDVSARYIREEFPSEWIETRPDGAIILTLAVGSRNWLLRWLLQYGVEAEILEPRSLREEMVEFLDAHLGGGKAS